MYVADWSCGIFQGAVVAIQVCRKAAPLTMGDFKVSGSGRSEVPCNITTAEPHGGDKLVEGSIRQSTLH